MTLCTDIVPQRKVEEYVDARNRILGLIEHGFKALQDANDVADEYVQYGFPRRAVERLDLDEARKDLDARFWRTLMDRTGLTSLLDAQAMQAFRNDLDSGKAPPFLMEEITTQVLSMHQTADAMFARGVYNVFRAVTHNWGDHETNKKAAFSVPRKIIVYSWFSAGWTRGLRVNHYRSDEVNDVDRIVTLLSGGKYTVRRLESALNGTFDGTTNHYEDEQLIIKGFKNGNGHITFKDQKTLEKINKTIANYCNGNALAAVRDKNYGGQNSQWSIKRPSLA
jgi:hypothetical protein